MAEPGVKAFQPQDVEFTDDQKRRLLGTLFPQLSVDENVLKEWNEHLQKLIQLIRKFQNMLPLFRSPNRRLFIRLTGPGIEGAVDAIMSAITLLRSHSTEPWSLMAERLRPIQGTSGFEPKSLAACVVYFWFHVEIEPQDIANQRRWSDERSLIENVTSRFPSSGPTTEAYRGLIMGHDFTGVNISRFYGVQIKKTDSLDRHLELELVNDSHMPNPAWFRSCWFIFLPFTIYYFLFKEVPFQSRRRRTILHVFCDMKVIDTLLLQKLDDGSPACPLPPKLYHEVYGSFSLLFPRLKHSWTYFGWAVSNKVDSRIFRGSGERNLSRYDVFNARLSALLDLYNSPTIHWWHPLIDRRNKREHFTLWIAIWAFIFGFFSMVTGLMSGIYAVKQYDLGLAAACAESGDHPRMKTYCG
ncbi:hypothetical protein LX32DRAFT_691267 [Colletotrichum zoysiae]|uniref:Uncharacterized protein n=1 Tax=Colletotrichum zoysiae TaxID=1216348 RepID=A0AAD9HN72_9PEZI|nr:hypothetical protein LX32DRAFT_691267 [Colletotrichum zoysiae]